MISPVLLSVEQMRAVDRDAVERTGLPSLILMENAGRGVAESVLRRLRPPASRPGRVSVVCGGGNNGGDGFVVARHLALAGAEVSVLLAVPRAKVVGDAAVMLRALDGVPGISGTDLSSGVASGVASGDASGIAGGVASDVATSPGTASAAGDWQRALSGADVIVDALFGTGLRADIVGVPAVAIAAMNAANALKVAVDIPSGLDANTGRSHGVPFRADVTVTMAARKLGLVLDAGAGVGEIEVVGLGAPILPPPSLGPYCYWLDEADVRTVLPRREGTAHKGSGGHLIVVAGSSGKTGAALLTGRGALRAGAGLVTIASTAAGQVALDAKVVEAMTARFSEGDDADGDSFGVITALGARPGARADLRAMALGPGIPGGPGMRALVERLARESPLPMVIDADGLNLLGDGAAGILEAASAPRIVTPHPGEMARLVGGTVAQVEADRLGTARAFAAASRAVVVLKGARTVVAAPDGTAFVNPAVEPALATAGSGDVLTGILGGLLAQGMGPVDATLAAVFLHGRAGAWAAHEHGVPGVIAGDLPDAVAAVRAAWVDPPHRETSSTKM